MADQPLKTWASKLTIDNASLAPQRRPLRDEEFQNGLLRLMSMTAQQLNQLFYLLTISSKSHPSVPELWPTSKAIPDESLEMNGQAILAAAYPNAFDTYGAVLPDMTGDAPTGFTYIIRKS